MDWYEKHLAARMDCLCPGVSTRLSEIGMFQEEAAEAVLRELLETGCLSQNTANIEAARKAVQELPPLWVTAHFPAAAQRCLFLEPEWQEWEFRRAAEMLRGAFPDALAWLVEYAGKLGGSEVGEAIQDLLAPEEGV